MFVRKFFRPLERVRFFESINLILYAWILVKEGKKVGLINDSFIQIFSDWNRVTLSTWFWLIYNIYSFPKSEVTPTATNSESSFEYLFWTKEKNRRTEISFLLMTSFLHHDYDDRNLNTIDYADIWQLMTLIWCLWVHKIRLNVFCIASAVGLILTSNCAHLVL